MIMHQEVLNILKDFKFNKLLVMDKFFEWINEPITREDLYGYLITLYILIEVL